MCVVYGTWITDFHIEQQFVQRSIGIITCSFLGDLSFFHHFHLILLTTLTHLVYQRLQFLQWCGFLWLLEMFVSHHLVVLGWQRIHKNGTFQPVFGCLLSCFLALTSFFSSIRMNPFARLLTLLCVFNFSSSAFAALLILFVNCVDEKPRMRTPSLIAKMMGGLIPYLELIWHFLQPTYLPQQTDVTSLTPRWFLSSRTRDKFSCLKILGTVHTRTKDKLSRDMIVCQNYRIYILCIFRTLWIFRPNQTPYTTFI